MKSKEAAKLGAGGGVCMGREILGGSKVSSF